MSTTHSTVFPSSSSESSKTTPTDSLLTTSTALNSMSSYPIEELNDCANFWNLRFEQLVSYDTSYLVKPPYTLEVCVGTSDSKLQQKENHPAVTKQAPKHHLQISPREPQPPMDFQVTRQDGLLQQDEDSKQHERSHRGEMITARP